MSYYIECNNSKVILKVPIRRKLNYKYKSNAYIKFFVSKMKTDIDEEVLATPRALNSVIWNVRTLYEVGKINSLILEMKRQREILTRL